MEEEFELIRRSTANTGTRRRPPEQPQKGGGGKRPNKRRKRRRKPVYAPGSPAAIKRRNRQRRRVIVLAAAVILIALAILFSTDVIFKVDNIRIETMDRQSPADTGIYTEEDIARATGVEPGTALFSVNCKKLTRQLLVQMPYLEEVKVRYSLPTTIVVQMSSAVESLYLQAEGGYAVLSETLRVLKIAETPPTGLIELRAAVDGQPQVGYTLEASQVSAEDKAAQTEAQELNRTLAEGLKEISAQFHQEQIYSRITAIDMADPDNVSVTLDYGIVVRLGTLNNLEYKCKMAGNILRNENGQGISDSEKGILDVSNSATTGKAYFAPNNGNTPAPDTSDTTDEEPPEEAPDGNGENQ